MLALATLQDVKQGLRIDTNDDDALLTTLIFAASEMIKNYLKSQADAVLDLDSSGEVTTGVEIPPLIVTACVMLVGYLYRSPDADPDGDFERGYLPKPVTAILYPLRDPALA